MKGAFLHVLGDALSSIGVLAGSILMMVTGWMIIDPLLSCVLAAIICWNAAGLFRDADKQLKGQHEV